MSRDGQAACVIEYCGVIGIALHKSQSIIPEDVNKAASSDAFVSIKR